MALSKVRAGDVVYSVYTRNLCEVVECVSEKGVLIKSIWYNFDGTKKGKRNNKIYWNPPFMVVYNGKLMLYTEMIRQREYEHDNQLHEGGVTNENI